MDNGERVKTNGSISQEANIRTTKMRPLLITICLVIFAAGIAALPNTVSKVRARGPQDQSRISSPRQVVPTGNVDDEADDPDLPSKFKVNIDKETYMRLRDEHVNLLRGIDPNAIVGGPPLRGAAIEQMEQQRERMSLQSETTLTTAPAWVEIGPRPIPNGQFQGGLSGPVTGRTTAVVVDPTNSNKVYVGSAQGGVWRSLNGGVTWVPIFDSAQSLAIGALVLDPTNPTILFVGTGENDNSLDSFQGVGIYRVKQADTSPILEGPFATRVAGTGTTASNGLAFQGTGINRIVIDPNDHNKMFIGNGVGRAGVSGTQATGASWGLYFCDNAQAVTPTFSRVNNVPGAGNGVVTDAAYEPGSSSNLLVSVVDFFGLGSGGSSVGGIYRSTNANTATTGMSGVSPTFTLTQALGKMITTKLAINKVSTTVTVYAATSETPATAACVNASNSGKVRKSTDGGATFPITLTAADGYCGGQCEYDQPIAVDPNNANILYLGGNARGTCSDVLKRSNNGGTTFTRDDNGLHADSHYIFFDSQTPTPTVWFANDGGVWKRPDAAAGTAWLNQNINPLGTLQFQSLAVHPTDRDLTIGGTQDNGTEAQQTTSGNWISAEGGDGGFALIDQSATNLVNVTMYHTFFNIKNLQIGFDRIINTSCLAIKDSWPTRGAFGGVNDPTPACDGTAFYIQNGINIADNVLFYAPMALGPGTPNTVYFGTDKLYRSTNRGDSMVIVSQNPLSGINPVTAIGISRQSDNVRIVATSDGKVFATATGSSSLADTAFTAPANLNGSTTTKYVARAVIDPNNQNTAYVTLAYFTNPATEGQVWKTTNLNAGPPTWTSVSSGIPNVPVNAFVVDPANSSNLFAGTDIGVFASTNGGTNWAPYGTGLPVAAVFDMAIARPNTAGEILRIATHGRGMWEIPLTAVGTDTVGLYNPDAGAFFLRNSNSSGVADISFSFGAAGLGWIPLVGDWDGDGTDTIGLYDPANGSFFLRNNNSSGVADISFSFGPAGLGWIPIVGDWNGDGVDTIGLYDPVHGAFFLRNTNSSGAADISFSFGPGGLGWIPLVGDWNGDGTDTIGLYDPVHGAFFLRNSNNSGVADISFSFGPGGLGWIPLVGDWNADGVDTIGLYDPAHGAYFLRNSNSGGVADISFSFGPAGLGWIPLAGDWDGL